MSPSTRYLGSLPRIRAVLGHTALYEIGGELDVRSDLGRPPSHPPYVLLAFGTLARVLRSTVRVETDLRDPALWDLARQLMVATLSRSGLDLPPPGEAPPAWHHWRRFRDDHLATDEGLSTLARLHLPRAVRLAQSRGLLRAEGPGSFTHPSTSRAVYGDGTIVRPIYAPPTAVRTVDEDGRPVVLYPDPVTGDLLATPPRRYDPDIADHHGHKGPVQGHGYVAWHARGDGAYQRVVLALDHIPAPGEEAATAVRLLRDVHRVARDGIQVAVYDGALHGVHIDEIMTTCGYLVIANQPAYGDEELATTAMVRTRSGLRAPSLPLRTFVHGAGATRCAHTLAAVNGGVADIDLDETGDPVVRSMLTRHAVKRARRSHGGYYFNAAYRLVCRDETLDVWISPHAVDGAASRPHHLRILADGDPDAMHIKGLRSDAEGVHSHYKRTLITNRAMSLGWRRGLVDYYCWAWYNNALTDQQPSAVNPSTRPVRLLGS